MLSRLLVVEDNHSLVSNLFAFFEQRGYTLDAAPDGVVGLQLAQTGNYDAMVLDWMLPRMEGKEVARRLRASGSDLPILMLTVRDELPDKLAGFGAGVDDYLTKPFAFDELAARVEALIARSQGRVACKTLRIGDLSFNTSTQEIDRNGAVLQLNASCKKILALLMTASPLVVARRTLESALWGDNPPDTDLLRSHVYDLRKAIDGPHESKLIQTVPKVGYRIIASEAIGGH